MELKRTIILTCCVIITSLGMALTGCSNSSSDKDAESNSAKYDESVSNTDAESSSETDAENSDDTDAESSSETDVESSSDTDTESNGDKYADSPYVGTWAAKVAEFEGNEYDANEVIGVTKFTFNADGTGIFDGDGLDADLVWEPNEDGLKFTDFDGDGYFTYKDGKLILVTKTEKGDITIYFEKLE